jgi:CheY-like chemotaxis protein
MNSNSIKPQDIYTDEPMYFTSNVLLAEDNVINQKVLQLMLKKLGYPHSDVAASGIEVLKALERQPYDVVLMDIGMPEMDGLQATRFIRQHWPAREQPHIIAVTAYGTSDAREACFYAGMDDFISKPVQMEELQSALNLMWSARETSASKLIR